MVRMVRGGEGRGVEGSSVRGSEGRGGEKVYDEITKKQHDPIPSRNNVAILSPDKVYDFFLCTSLGIVDAVLSNTLAMPIIIRSGHKVWNEFLQATGINVANTVALFDKHDVIDTLNREEAIESGCDLEHGVGVRNLVCSYGTCHRKETFDKNKVWYPFVNEMDGFIFTDQRKAEGRYYNQINIYREDWMGITCIGVKGDKGQVAELIGKPVVLFDDKEENIRLLRDRSTAHTVMDGVVVRRGNKCGKRIQPGFEICNEARLWAEMVKKFDRNHGRGYGYEVHGDSVAGISDTCPEALVTRL